MRLIAHTLLACLAYLAIALYPPAHARENAGQTAIIHELRGSADLLKANRPAGSLRLNQRLVNGDIIDINKESLVEITYNNGCSEIVNTAARHEIDACKCQTSPFRKGITDPFNATLKQIKGEVLIFRENKYVPVSDNMRVRNGDRLLVMRNATATIVYDHGCQENVKASSIHKVDGCSARCPVRRLVDRVPDQPIPETPVATSSPPAVTPTTPPPTPTVDPAVITAIIALPLIFDDDDDDKKAVSP